jgi:hypothetical protein
MLIHQGSIVHHVIDGGVFMGCQFASLPDMIVYLSDRHYEVCSLCNPLPGLI